MVKETKKGQAAMEFLMTYGWAILVVLVVIGALSYFGVLSPATLLPEKCTFPVSVSCVDHSVSSNSITLVLQNGAGRDMIVAGINASSDALSGVGCNMSVGLPLANGERNSFTLDKAPVGEPVSSCNFVSTGRDKNRYNIIVQYSWLDSPDIVHELPGELLARGP